MNVLKLALCTTASTLVLAGTPTFAQATNQTTADSVLGGDIVVTAQRREQSLSDVGLSITAIGGAALQERNFNSVTDLGKMVAGLSVNDTGFAQPIYTLRGVGVNEQSLGSNSSVAVYVDEVPLTYPATTQGATFDLQRVEVLKGPQGTLYGSNATGGAINYIANKPTDEFEAGVGGTFGRFKRGNAEGYVSGPLGPTLKARIAGRASFGSDWQRSITRNDSIGKIENYTGRMIVDWEPSERLRFSLNLNGWLDKSDPFIPQLLMPAPISLPKVLNAPRAPRNARLTDWDPNKNFRRDDKFWQASLRADLDATDEVTFTSITSYAEFDKYQFLDMDGIGSAVALTNEQEGHIETFNQEVRMTANFNGITWVIGGNLSHDKTYDFVDQKLPDSSQISNIFGFSATGASFFADQKIKNWAVFSNLDIPLTSKLTLGGGIRLTQDKRSYQGCTVLADLASQNAYTALINSFRSGIGLGPLAQPIQVGQCATVYTTLATLIQDTGNPRPGLGELTVAHRKLKEHNVPWTVNLNYKPTEDSLLYGRVSRGFKSGNFSSLSANNASAFFPVVQEELTAYEVGGRARIGNFARIEGALFHYAYNNKQLRARVNIGPPIGNITAQDNIPKSRLRGAELSATIQPIKRLTLAVSGVYIDSKIQRYVGQTVNAVTVDFAGAEFNFTPKWSVNADLNYSHPLTDSIDAFGGINVAHRSKTAAVFKPLTGDNNLDIFDIDSYTLVDGQLGIESTDKNWKAFIWGKNIFNKFYTNNVLRFSTVNIRFPGAPATYGVTLAYKF